MSNAEPWSPTSMRLKAGRGPGKAWNIENNWAHPSSEAFCPPLQQIYKNGPDHLRHRNHVNFLCDTSLSLCLSTTLRCKTCHLGIQPLYSWIWGWIGSAVDLHIVIFKCFRLCIESILGFEHIAFSRHTIRSLTSTVHENEWLVDCSRSFAPIRNSWEAEWNDLDLVVRSVYIPSRNLNIGYYNRVN